MHQCFVYYQSESEFIFVTDNALNRQFVVCINKFHIYFIYLDIYYKEHILYINKDMLTNNSQSTYLNR